MLQLTQRAATCFLGLLAAADWLDGLATLRCRGRHVISEVSEGVQLRRVSGYEAASWGVTLRNGWPSRLELYWTVCEDGGVI